MSRRFSYEKSAFLFLLCIIFIGILPAAEPNSDFVPPPGRTGHHLSPSEIAANEKYKAKKALEAYNKRNAEIDSWIEEDTIKDYNNAALLYYQALLLRPDLNQAVINKFNDVSAGAEPDTQIRIYLGQWLPSMKVSEIASRIPQCTWSVWSGRVWYGENTNQGFLMSSFRQFSYIIAVDAITLASDGHYRAALERCMTLRRIARHLSYDSNIFLASSSCNNIALITISRILGDMSLDADILTWFRGRLAAFQEVTTLLEGLLQENLKAKTEMVQLSSIPRLRGMLLKRAADEEARQQIRNLTDDQIRKQALEAVHVFFGSIFTILHSDKSAERKYAEIQQVTTHDTINHYDLTEPLKNICDELGMEAFGLITGIDTQLPEEKRLDEIQKIIDKSEEPNTIELLEKYSNTVGEDIDFGFLVNDEMTDKQKRTEMQRVIGKLNDAFAVKMSRLGLSWNEIGGLVKSYMGYRKAQVNSIRAAVELYLIMAKTGQLPEELPDDLPKDPYTGRNFLYEITDDGFVLGCRSDMFKGGKARFTFHVKKKSN